MKKERRYKSLITITGDSIEDMRLALKRASEYFEKLKRKPAKAKGPYVTGRLSNTAWVSFEQ